MIYFCHLFFLKEIYHRQIIERAYEALKADCRIYRPEDSGLMALMNKPVLHDHRMGPHDHTTTVQIDSFVHPSRGSDIGSNRHEIHFTGTAKATNHPPGYDGHIPFNTRNLRKQQHAGGGEARGVKNDLMLTQRTMGCCVLGYAGD